LQWTAAAWQSWQAIQRSGLAQALEAQL
jgi:hypothetical protein